MRKPRSRMPTANVLANGDAVVLMGDLKVRVRRSHSRWAPGQSIRLVGGDHEVDCKMDAGTPC